MDGGLYVARYEFEAGGMGSSKRESLDSGIGKMWVSSPQVCTRPQDEKHASRLMCSVCVWSGRVQRNSLPCYQFFLAILIHQLRFAERAIFGNRKGFRSDLRSTL